MQIPARGVVEAGGEVCILPARGNPYQRQSEQQQRMSDETDGDLEQAEEFEEELDADVDEDEIVDLDEDALDDDLVDDDEIVDDEVVAEEGNEEAGAAAGPAAKSEEDEDDLEEIDPDDVEADLDTILKDRIAAADDEEEDEEEAVADTEDRGDGSKIQPRRPGEFVCQSCFLLKSHSQLADEKHQYCSDCV